MRVVDTIFELFHTNGADAYLGEAVSQQEHALQTAYLAEQAGADDALVVSALLHDIGHLLHGLPEHIAEKGIDGRHEEAGEHWLMHHAEPVVTEPLRLHVAAKRYLCAVDPDYRALLSPESIKSLQLQGGSYTEDEVNVFEKNPCYQDAVRLRRWDDQAKVVGLDVPELAHYRSKLENVLY